MSLSQQQKEELKKEFLARFSGYSPKRKKDQIDFWLSKLDTIIDEKIAMIKKAKRTDEAHMSDDHTFDEALDTAIKILQD